MPRAATRYRLKSRPVSPKRPQPYHPSTSPRKELELKLAKKAQVQPLLDSDDSDKLVVKGAGGRRGRYLAKNEVFASGAIRKGDNPGSHPTRAQLQKKMREARREQYAESSEPIQLPELSLPQSTEPHKNYTAVVSSSVPASVLRHAAAQPTPSRENSILDGIRPRKRQNSILRALELENSSLGARDDSFALPDDESTPLNLSKSKVAGNALQTPQLSTSASRKRKLGSDEPVGSDARANSSTKQNHHIAPAEPTLPPQSFSTLRESGRKQRLQAEDDVDAVMALPMSSSSSASPAKSKPSSSSKLRNLLPPPPLLTEQLQALMPTKRRKTTRNRTTVFDIPPDSDSSGARISETEETSIFQPSRRKAHRTRPRAKPAATKLRPKRNPTPASHRPTRATKSKPSTRLTPSRSSANQATKSPLQQSTHTTTTTTVDARTRASTRSQSTTVALSGTGKRSGGFHGKTTTGGVIEEKENYPREEGNEIGDTVDVGYGRLGEDEDRGEGEEESRFVERQVTPSPKEKKTKSMWDDIDAWSLEFEDVEVYERSSEKDAR